MKADLKKLDHYRARPGELELLTVPPTTYLAIDGAGDPNTARAYRQALEALYPLAYAVKFLAKAAGRDYVIPPLEGLWWADDYAAFTSARDKDEWKWTMMIAVPDIVPESMVDEARDRVSAKKKPPTALEQIRLHRLNEGQCVQTLHVGAYDDEGPILEELHAFIRAEGLRPSGEHHEIYLSDPRRTDASKLKTILRQPVEPV